MRIIYHLCLTDTGRTFLISLLGKVKGGSSPGGEHQKPKGMRQTRLQPGSRSLHAPLGGGSATQRRKAATEDPPKREDQWGPTG